MESLFTNLLSEQSTATALILIVGLIIFFFFLRREFRHDLEAEIAPIKVALNNHITDTNKKIDDFKAETKETFKELKQDIKENYKETQAIKQGQIETNAKLDRLLNEQSHKENNK